ncbi:helix-turn-helix transcriptional regulator [Burkholderia vietnamiensis]|uniref:helix-turn-helix transcriptional regulator n=1 Tax=Burkholderia vietnamiensis TaxID=60552 RepID=UPI0012D91442|nr:helix-turn-helix domain-containing protein [Burkholderia vietnamiensis]
MKTFAAEREKARKLGVFGVGEGGGIHAGHFAITTCMSAGIRDATMLVTPHVRGISEQEARMETMFLRRPDAARELRVSEDTIKRLERAGELPLPIKIGRAVGWRRETLAAWLKQREEAAHG